MTVGENVVLKLLAYLALPYFFLLRLGRGFNVGRPPLEAHEPRIRIFRRFNQFNLDSNNCECTNQMNGTCI